MPRIPLLLLFPLVSFTPVVFAETKFQPPVEKVLPDPGIEELRAKQIEEPPRPPNEVPDEFLTRMGLHRVRAGETLKKIAAMAGVSPKDILALNPSMNPNALKVGQLIRIRPSTTQDAAVAKPAGPEDRMLRKGMPRAEVAKRLAAAGATPTNLEMVSPGSDAPPDCWDLPKRADTLVLAYDGEGRLTPISVQCDSDMPKAYRHGYVTDSYLLPAKPVR